MLWFVCDYGVILYMDGIIWDTNVHVLGYMSRWKTMISGNWQLSQCPTDKHQEWTGMHLTAQLDIKRMVAFISYIFILPISHIHWVKPHKFSSYSEYMAADEKCEKPSTLLFIPSPIFCTTQNCHAWGHSSSACVVMDASVTSDSEIHSNHVTKQRYEKAANVSTYINHTEQCCFFSKKIFNWLPPNLPTPAMVDQAGFPGHFWKIQSTFLQDLCHQLHETWHLACAIRLRHGGNISVKGLWLLCMLLFSNTSKCLVRYCSCMFLWDFAYCCLVVMV